MKYKYTCSNCNEQICWKPVITEDHEAFCCTVCRKAFERTLRDIEEAKKLGNRLMVEKAKGDNVVFLQSARPGEKEYAATYGILPGMIGTIVEEGVIGTCIDVEFCVNGEMIVMRLEASKLGVLKEVQNA